MRTKVAAEGGRVSAINDTLEVSKADAVTLFIAIRTNFENYQSLAGNPEERSTPDLAAAIVQDFPAVRRQHIQRYQQQFNRGNLTSAITRPSPGPRTNASTVFPLIRIRRSCRLFSNKDAIS